MPTNTRILANGFDYFAPASLAQTLQLLDEYPQMRVLAGGTDLLVKMKAGKLDAAYLMDIKRVEGMSGIFDEGSLVIAAATPLSAIEKSTKVKEEYVALFEAVRSMAAPAIKNMGTIGGNICNASPAADTAPPLIAFGAEFTLRSINGERSVPAEEFFIGPGVTVLSPKELLIEINIPPLSTNTGSSFLKIGRVSADIAKINVAVVLRRQGDMCQSCRIVFGSVAAKPIKVKGAEEVLEGKKLNSHTLKETADRASEEIDPITDIRSSAEYRRELCRYLTEEAVQLAWERAGAGR
ncbi:MAG: xanthine dehydrogenase family protein subunit M [Chloroflexi bacterium]|nr:xanthine dehydrogenase family protein subunit M [Chloroflexota bacterium]